MGTPSNKGYKRSWKNLLLNKRYQLRFTLFMVGVSTLLMLGLGYWVLSEAADATKITRNDIETRRCEPKKKSATQPGAAPAVPAATPDTPEPDTEPEPETDTESESEPDTGEAPGSDETGEASPKTSAETSPGSPGTTEPTDEGDEGDEGDGQEDAAEGERPPREIKIEIGEMKLDPTVLEQETSAGAAPALTDADLARCQKEKAAQLEELDDGYMRIQLVLIVFGVLLVLGLTVFGIKMTHKVAGPLYKVTLYFDKMRKGTLDKVYPLRKGDQLIEFYEQFREAHAGLEDMEKKDIEVLSELLDAADDADLAARSPEIASLIDELRELLERKKNSLA